MIPDDFVAEMSAVFDAQRLDTRGRDVGAGALAKGSPALLSCAQSAVTYFEFAEFLRRCRTHQHLIKRKLLKISETEQKNFRDRLYLTPHPYGVGEFFNKQDVNHFWIDK